MENFGKMPERPETKEPEPFRPNFWEDIEKKAKDSRIPTAQDKIEEWWDNLINERGESHELIKNKEDGLRREKEVADELEEKYKESDGYKILSETYLRDKDGNIVKDPMTGEGRRIDYVVVDKDGNVVDSIEVTSKTADKTEQSAKEARIRDSGGNYVKMPDGTLAQIPADVHTRIERKA